VLQDMALPIRFLAFDARGSRLVVVGEEHTVRVFETEGARARALQRASVDTLPTLEEAAELKPMEVEARCRRVVEHAGLDLALYAHAEELARAAAERLKDSGEIATTLAGAIYRQDRHEEALTLLVEASDKRRGWPPNLAFRVMALAKQGKLDDAKFWMQRLDTLLSEARWKSDAEVRACADEARAVLAAARAAAR
jgi:hypothetical protein